MFAHVHQHAKGYFAHGGNWMELVNKETTETVGTGTETYNVGFLDATNLDVTGITTLEALESAQEELQENSDNLY